MACFPRDLASAAAEVESHPVRQKETPGLSGRFSVVISSGVWYTRFDLSGIGGGKMIKLFGKKQRFADGRRNNNKDGICGYGAVLRFWAVRTSGRKSRLRKAAAEEADRLIPDHRRFPVVISAARPVPVKRRAKKALLSDRQKSFSVACFDASRYNCLRNTD